MADIDVTPDLDQEMKSLCSLYEADFELFGKDAFWNDLKNKSLNSFKKSVKQHYLKCQDYRCAYCRQKIYVTHGAAWDIEHIVPKKLKPLWMLKLKNLCVICKDCNNEKSDKNTLVNSSVKNIPKNPDGYVIYNPHVHEYEDHICVISEGELYWPLSDLGRRTSDFCGFSRFPLNLEGIGIKSSGNALLMMKVVEKMVNEENDETFRKLNNLVLVLTKSNKNILDKRAEQNADEVLSKLLG